MNDWNLKGIYTLIASFINGNINGLTLILSVLTFLITILKLVKRNNETEYSINYYGVSLPAGRYRIKRKLFHYLKGDGGLPRPDEYEDISIGQDVPYDGIYSGWVIPISSFREEGQQVYRQKRSDEPILRISRAPLIG